MTLNPLLPATLDNTYRGHKLALWLFGLLLFMKAGMSLSSIFNGHSTLMSADGIPLDVYPSTAAQTIVALFALMALSNLTICAACLVVLVRYRSGIPFLFALLVAQHLGRNLILRFLPLFRVGSPPASTIHLILLTVMIVGLALSLWRPRNVQTGNSSEGTR